MEHHTKSWLLALPGLPSHPGFLHVNGALLVFGIILVLSIAANRAIRGKLETYLIPTSRPTFVSIIDFGFEALHNLIVGIVAHHGEKHVPFLAACFIFILISNFLGLLPFGGAPTANTNTTFALGIATFLYYNIMGIREQGLVAYAKHFLNGLGIFGILIALLEVVSHCIRPLSLGLRLFINLHIDHMLVGSFEQIFAWLLPIPFLLFGVFVATLQAFLFTVLSAVYVHMATDH